MSIVFNESPKLTYMADGTLDNGGIETVSVKNEIMRLSSKVKILEDQINELRASFPAKCPKCGKCSEPVLKSYYDLNCNSKITGIRKIYKLCPCCNFVFMEYDG